MQGVIQVAISSGLKTFFMTDKTEFLLSDFANSNLLKSHLFINPQPLPLPPKSGVKPWLHVKTP
jgi:hypothetical protein